MGLLKVNDNAEFSASSSERMLGQSLNNETLHTMGSIDTDCLNNERVDSWHDGLSSPDSARMFPGMNSRNNNNRMEHGEAVVARG